MVGLTLLKSVIISASALKDWITEETVYSSGHKKDTQKKVLFFIPTTPPDLGLLSPFSICLDDSA